MRKKIAIVSPLRLFKPLRSTIAKQLQFFLFCFAIVILSFLERVMYHWRYIKRPQIPNMLAGRSKNQTYTQILEF